MTSLVGLLYNSMSISNQTIVTVKDLSQAHDLNSSYITDYIETRHGKYSAPVYKAILHHLPKLERTTYKQFLKESASDFRILACRVDEYDCKKDWSHVPRYQGMCAQLNTLPGRELSVVVGYDRSDWSAGWTSFMDGMTIYYNDWNDTSLEEKTSFQATSRNIPMVRLQLNNFTGPSKPYSECVISKKPYPVPYNFNNCNMKCQGNTLITFGLIELHFS